MQTSTMSLLDNMLFTVFTFVFVFKLNLRTKAELLVLVFVVVVVVVVVSTCTVVSGDSIAVASFVVVASAVVEVVFEFSQHKRGNIIIF